MALRQQSVALGVRGVERAGVAAALAALRAHRRHQPRVRLRGQQHAQLAHGLQRARVMESRKRTMVRLEVVMQTRTDPRLESNRVPYLGRRLHVVYTTRSRRWKAIMLSAQTTKKLFFAYSCLMPEVHASKMIKKLWTA